MWQILKTFFSQFCKKRGACEFRHKQYIVFLMAWVWQQKKCILLLLWWLGSSLMGDFIENGEGSHHLPSSSQVACPCLIIMILPRYIPYAIHQNLLLIRNRSWTLTIRTEFVWKKLLENIEMDFKNGLKNIQVTGYNGAHTVCRVLQKLKWTLYRADGTVLSSTKKTQ